MIIKRVSYYTITFSDWLDTRKYYYLIKIYKNLNFRLRNINSVQIFEQVENAS